MRPIWTAFSGFALSVCLSLSATAHDQWANGQPIPDWVKSSCCGPADAHHLRADQVIDHGDYYTVEGVEGFSDEQKIPGARAIPSQDGDYWLFFSNYSYGGTSERTVFCFFVPFAG